MTFNDIAAGLQPNKKFMARYFTYKDWRDSGPYNKVRRRQEDAATKPQHTKRYNSRPQAQGLQARGTFFPGDMITVIDDDEKGKELYQEHWFGQYGTYKLQEHGSSTSSTYTRPCSSWTTVMLKVTNSTKKADSGRPQQREGRTSRSSTRSMRTGGARAM